eukprot:3845248-Alexandrium_andersonii.AAC.1
MSASLVGSEMCIRDRLPGLGFPAGPRAGGFPPRAGLGVPWRASALGLGGCLLYTSDAADDM